MLPGRRQVLLRGAALVESTRMSKSASWMVCLVAVAGLGCFFLWPIGEILRNVFLDADGHFTGRFLLEVLLKPIYLEVLGEGRSVAAALGVWAMVFPALSLLITHRLMGRKLGALFRL